MRGRHAPLLSKTSAVARTVCEATADDSSSNIEHAREQCEKRGDTVHRTRGGSRRLTADAAAAVP